MRQPSSPPTRTARPDTALAKGWWAAGPDVRKRIAASRSGVTTIEYALIATLIIVAIAASVGGFTSGLGAMMANSFGQIASAM
jgi:Flp pilus assembly pilin Flp